MNTARGFGDFLTLHNPEFLKKVPVISTEEFIEREGKENGRFPIPVELQFKVNNAKKECLAMKIGKKDCIHVTLPFPNQHHLNDQLFISMILSMNRFQI